MATCLIVSRLEVRRRRDALLLWSEQSPYAVAGLGGMRRPRAVVNGIPRPSPPTRWPPKANPASLSKRTQTSDVTGSGNERTDTTIWYASFTPLDLHRPQIACSLEGPSTTGPNQASFIRGGGYFRQDPPTQLCTHPPHF